jgi:hypothetical protein
MLAEKTLIRAKSAFSFVVIFQSIEACVTRDTEDVKRSMSCPITNVPSPSACTSDAAEEKSRMTRVLPSVCTSSLARALIKCSLTIAL